MATGYTAVSATNLCDATGTVITNATISFEPVDNKGNSISFRAGGTSEGQASSQPVSTTVTNGAFTIQLADTTLTTPKNVGYTVTVIDNVTGDDLLGPDGYICVQPSGAEWSFDTYDPNYAAQITVQQGPQGLSAYEVYQSAGGTLDEADWLASLHGATGAPGASGIVGIPIYATAAEGAAAGTGAAVGGYYMVPSPSADNCYDVYQNDGGVAFYQKTLGGPNVSSTDKLLSVSDGLFRVDLFDVDDEGHPYSIQYEPRVAALETIASGGSLTSSDDYVLSIEAGGFVLPIIDLEGNLLRPLSTSLPDTGTLNTLINKINQTCIAHSRAVRNRFNLLGTGLEYDYNIVILDGQSMMSTADTSAVYSTVAKHGNKGLGQGSRWADVTSGGPAAPIGDTNLDPLVEVGAESPASGCANMLKNYLNRAERTTESAKTLVFTNIAVPGTSIEQHLPGSTVGNLFNRVIGALTDIKADIPVGKTAGVVAVWWCQGEFNNTDTEAYYTTQLQALRAGYDAQIQAIFGQTQKASWFISQSGGSWMADATPGVQSAQVNYALSTPDTYCIGNYYPLPYKPGSHRSGNGFRWFGTWGGRVMGEVLVERRGWEPLRPISTTWAQGNLLVGFHVPQGVLTIQPCIGYANPTTYPDLGFSLFDAQGYIPCTVTIAADAVVMLQPSRTVDQATAYLHYADAGGDQGPTGAASPIHIGMGNLADSNPTTCEDVYAYPDQDGPGFDIPSLSNLPYPQNNFCVAFQIHNLNNFTGLIG